MKLYKFLDDETFYIAARSKDEALALYLRDCTEEEPDDLVVKEIDQEKWKEIPVRDEDAPGGRTTVAVIIGDPNADADAFLVASSCY